MTVGYGNFHPTTVVRRLVALAMMLAGIRLIGLVTGSLASWVVERIADADKPDDATGDSVALLGEIRELRRGRPGCGLHPRRREGPPGRPAHRSAGAGGPNRSGSLVRSRTAAVEAYGLQRRLPVGVAGEDGVEAHGVQHGLHVPGRRGQAQRAAPVLGLLVDTDDET